MGKGYLNEPSHNQDHSGVQRKDRCCVGISPTKTINRCLVGYFRLSEAIMANPIELVTYYKILKELIGCVCNVWRHRCTMVILKKQNSAKFEALQDVDSLLDSFNVTYVK